MPYQHFTMDERDALQTMKAMGLATDEMARIIGKDPSSLYRELSRNALQGCYISWKADKRASTRRNEACPCPVRGNRRLMSVVERLIREQVAPDQIVGRIKLERGSEPEWHISYETIYQHIYDQARQGNDLRGHLRHARKARHKRSANKDRRGIIPDRIFIDDRPSIVDRKYRRGDWEGDTIEGAHKKGYVVTFVDRKTKYLVAYKISHKSTLELVRGSRKAFRHIPLSLRKTVTVDNGKEFAAHKELARQIGAKIYFAHPYHSWERGLSEHTNGLLRQYLPKSRSLLDLPPHELAKIVERINNRPRKSLGYRTPREAFFKLPLALQI
jgi:transposase, IS30 family